VIKPKGRCSIQRPQAKGKTGRVNASEPSMMPRYVEPRRWDDPAGSKDWPLRSGTRRLEDGTPVG